MFLLTSDNSHLLQYYYIKTNESQNFLLPLFPEGEFTKVRQLEGIINLDDITMIDFLEKECKIPETICCRYNPGGTYKVWIHFSNIYYFFFCYKGLFHFFPHFYTFFINLMVYVYT